ncbi:cilia- and flagella-associated protein 36-like, partial [Gigantopelta aegis]|uniref:cilia- and flagella-associated protein 36-like n=1 Tax=Gigantopelta aegis TaxID=1735272 RepID=UPI001B88B977
TEWRADVEWMMDSLVQFLMSPVWSFHVNNFVDQNCLIFDTEEENNFHTQMLIDNTKTIKLFQPLLAVDDFLLFKSIMVQRNLQLDEEVLKNLQDSETSPIHNKEVSSTPTSSTHVNEEDKILQDILLKSKIEHEQHVQQEEEQFQKLIRQATEESLKTYELEVKKSAQANSSDPVLTPGTVMINEEDSVQKREDYLKRQRDQLIARKVKKREAELKDFLKDNPPSSENGSVTHPPMNNIAVNCQKERKAIKGKEKRKAKPVLTPAVADKITH